MKGVSAIIATILMLVITIGLAGTAYVYISGMLTGKTAQTISILDYSCSLTGTTKVVNLVVSNDGTMQIPDGTMRIFVDNIDRTTVFGAYTTAGVWGNGNKVIDPHTTKPILNDPGAAVVPAWLGMGTREVLVTTPSNSQRIQVLCP